MPSEAARDFTDFLHGLDVADVDFVLAYDGDDYTTVFIRDDVEAEFGEQEFEEMAKQFILKSLDDWPEQPEFARYGHLDIVSRWLHEILVVQIPVTEWGGVIASFDRDSIEETGRLLDAILDYVDDPEHGLREQEFDDETAAEAAEEHFG